MSNSDGYTIKERIEDLAKTIAGQLSGIVTQLDAIERKLDEKASVTRVMELERDVRTLTERVTKLEFARAGSIAISGLGKWLVGAIISGGLLTLIYYALGGHR